MFQSTNGYKKCTQKSNNKTQTTGKNTPKTTPTKSARPHIHKKEHPPTPQPQEDPSPIKEKKGQALRQVRH
jgi:hypothetical protein